METLQNTDAEAGKVAAVVASWGEGFRSIAAHPRISFEGEALTVKLWRPIRVSGEEVGELAIREPSMDELKKLDGAGGPIAQAQRMIVSVASITEREAGQIGLRDLTTIGAIFAAFTAAAPATGLMSSES